MKFKVRYVWKMASGGEDKYTWTLDKDIFLIMYGPLFKEFGKMAQPGDSLEVNLGKGDLYYLVQVLKGEQP